MKMRNTAYRVAKGRVLQPDMPCFGRRNAAFYNAGGNVLTATQLPVRTDVTVAPVGCRLKSLFAAVYLLNQCNKIETELFVVFFYVRYLFFSQEQGGVVAVFKGVLYEEQCRTYAETAPVVVCIVAYKH